MGRKVAAKRIALSWAVSYAILNITSGILGEQGLEKTILWGDSLHSRSLELLLLLPGSTGDNVKPVKALSKLLVKLPIF